MPTVTLDQVIDSAMELSPEQREMLVEILYKRQLEARRHEIAVDAQASRAAFRQGNLKPQSVEEAIRELQQGLEDDE